MKYIQQLKNSCRSLAHISATIFMIAFIGACAQSDFSTSIYGESGKPIELARCPVGAYELCLKKLSDLCQEEGYEILEKTRQAKSGIWSDTLEVFIIARCRSPK